MADGEERDYKGSRFEMVLMGSGWIKETKTKRKYQRFIINNDIELKAKDVLCVYIAKTRRNENSPQYYIFHDVNSRKKRDRKEDPEPDNGRNPDNADDF